MAHELKRYWFVAAVFREPGNLVSTIATLRANNFPSNGVLVLADHAAAEVRQALAASAVGPVAVVDVHSDGAASTELPVELITLLKDMAAAGREGASAKNGSPVYAQLREAAAEGAVVLIASAADPEAQLAGARILLRGNSECVLTHEIAAAGT